MESIPDFRNGPRNVEKNPKALSANLHRLRLHSCAPRLRCSAAASCLQPARSTVSMRLHTFTGTRPPNMSSVRVTAPSGLASRWSVPLSRRRLQLDVAAPINDTATADVYLEGSAHAGSAQKAAARCAVGGASATPQAGNCRSTAFGRAGLELHACRRLFDFADFYMTTHQHHNHRPHSHRPHSHHSEHRCSSDDSMRASPHLPSLRSARASSAGGCST
jgi:hypothetical protein